MRAHGRTAALAAAALLLVGLATALGPRRRHPATEGDAGAAGDAGSPARSALPVRRAPTSMPAAAARPAWRPVVGDSVASVAGFTRLGDTLVVLDPIGRRVHLLRADATGWQVVGGWGRRGGGPGEFQQPVAVAALAGDTIAVAEESGRVQLFTADGRHRRTERSGFPCMMFGAGIAYDHGGARWLAGLCIGSRAAADTLFLALFHAPPDGEWTEVLRVPRMTLDLSWGEVVATQRPLSDAGGMAWLGIGLDECAYELRPGADTAHRRCALVAERLSAPPPAGLREDVRRAERRGDQRMMRALRWPEALPAYFGLVRDARGGTVLARPVSGDSMALVPAHEALDGRAVRLVAPLRPFVQCVRGACLWFDAEGGRIALHDASGVDVARARGSTTIAGAGPARR